MRPRNQRKRSASSPSRARAPFEPSEPAPGPTSGASPRAVSLEEAETAERESEWGVFERNPRSFPYWVKQQCWDKAEKVKGRDPERWRRDPLGNLVFRKLVGCLGCLCHDYDHILPFSKGGKSTLENCQVLQAKVNRSKGNKTEISNADLIQKSAYCRVSGRDMDLLEMSAFGNVSRGEDSGGCRIQ